MAKKEEAPKTVLERNYNIPLRKEWLKSPKWKRAKKASKAAREFLIKHMKSDNVKLGKYMNEEIWKRGSKSPPHHVKVKVTKDSEGLVKAELEGAPVEAKEEEKGKEPVKEEKKEEKAEEAKKEEKEEKPEEKEKVVVEKEKEPKKEEKEKPAEKKQAEEVEKLAKDIVRKESLKK